MNQAYINAYLHIKPLAYGKHLSPLTIGHSLILDFISSPFFTGKIVNENDLLTAVFFCSQDFESGIDYLTNREKLLKTISKWSKEINESKVRYDFQTELNTFRTYLDYYMTFPRRWENENGQIDPKTPWQFSILWVLLEKFTEHDALNMPLTKAMAFVACYNNQMGENNLAGLAQSDLLDKWEQEEKEAISNV